MKNDKKAQSGEKMPLLVEVAYKYHVRGFTAAETAKMMDISERTVQRWAADYSFLENTDPLPFSVQLLELSKKGFSYADIAQKMKCSKTTVYNHIKKTKGIKR